MLVSYVLGDAKVPNANGFASQWNIGLYSTRTQNTWRRGLALGSAPDARILRYPTQRYQHVGISKRENTRRQTLNLRHLTQNPQRKSVEYRLRWVPNANCLRRPCTFHFFGVDFICVWCQRKPRFQWNMGFRLKRNA